MNNCDIYLMDEVPGNSIFLNQLKIFQKDLIFDKNANYVGYLNMNIRRITGVAIVIHLRTNRIGCLNIPIKYRDLELLSEEEVNLFASKYASSYGLNAISRQRVGEKPNPMFANFYFDSETSRSEKVSGGFTIDRLDGHIWTEEEMVEYMYDYNNII